MGEHFFSPSTLVVKVGTTVTWQLFGSHVHDVIAFDGSFRSREMGPGDRFSHTFTAPGRYPYFCAPHVGDGMEGVVIVEEADR